jgi:hypothetical protein
MCEDVPISTGRQRKVEMRRFISGLAGPQKENRPMLVTIAVILLILWAVGLVSAYTLGGFIHILLVVALVIIVIRLIQGRRL